MQVFRALQVSIFKQYPILLMAMYFYSPLSTLGYLWQRGNFALYLYFSKELSETKHSKNMLIFKFICPTVFTQICCHLGKLFLDLFASRLCRKLRGNKTWQSDPPSVATNAFQQDWTYIILYAFPPFSMIGRV